MKKKVLLALLSVGMMMGVLMGPSAMLPVQAVEEEVLESGGETLYYENFEYSVNTDSESGEKYISITGYEEQEGVTEVVIPAEIDGIAVTHIGGGAFSECSSLTSIEIPEGVTEIDEYVFCGCSSLTSIEIPESVTSIGASAFSGCSSLTSIEIPEGVTSIEEDAFRGCSSLTSIEIPVSITRIDYGAFSGTALTDIYYYGTEQEWKMIDKFNIDIDEEVTTIHYGQGKLPNTPTEPETPEDTQSPATPNNPNGTGNPNIPSDSNTQNYDSVKISNTSLSIDTIGATADLTLENVPTGTTVTWTTDNAQVATVTNGKVTAVGSGTATITAKVGDKTVTATVTVSQKSEKVSITLNGQAVKGTLRAKVKKTYTLKADVTPSTVDTQNGKVTWTTSNAKIAIVNDNGKVSVKKAGKVTITATTADDKSASVTFKAEKKAVKVTKLKINGKKTMKAKKSQKLTVTVTPATADNKKVTWKSSNTKIATVTSKGKLTAKKKGTVTITATAKDGSNKKATIKIKVK